MASPPRDDDDAYNVKRERAPSPPRSFPHESMFEHYLLTTPVLGGAGGLPQDALMQLCLQVSVWIQTKLKCAFIHFFALFVCFHAIYRNAHSCPSAAQAASEAAVESHHRHSS